MVVQEVIQKPLPESREGEQAVLGAMLLDPKVAIDEAVSRLNGIEFNTPEHRKLFKVLRDMAEDNVAIDLVTVTSRLRDKGWLEDVGGVGYLGKLHSGVPTASNVGHYVGLVIEKYKNRQLILDLREQLHQAETAEDAAAVIADTQAKMEAIAELGGSKKDMRPVAEIVMEVYEDVERRYTNKQSGSITGQPSGFDDLDRMTSGFQRSDLIIIAARPSVGKTALALNIARNTAVSTQETVAVFSLEMSEKQLVQRMVCADGNLDAGRIRTGHLEDDDWHKLTMAVGSISDMPIVIDDTPSISVSEIRAKCRRIKKERGLGMILIDYLQLLSGQTRSNQSRQDEVSFISRTLKAIARELDVPVIALSQLSRAVEQRQDKRPMLSDLRESGSLEQDADIVAFLYRDDYYDKESEKKNIIEINLAKQRNGPVGTVELAFLKQFNKFVSLDRSHYDQQPPPRPSPAPSGKPRPEMWGGRGR